MAQAVPPSFDEQNFSQAQEIAWIEVIQKMEEVYSDLIQYEIELEEKNAALEEAQRFITSVLSSVSDILVVCDPKGAIQQVNLAFLKLTDFAEADLIGRPLSDVLAGDFNPLHGHDREVRLRARTGGLTDPVALTCSTLFDHRGLPAGTVLTGRPVGELRRAYEALKRAQAQLVQQEKMASIGRLVAGVAHELNNPISFVVGNVHVLTKYRERLSVYLEAIHSNAPRLERDKLRATLRIDALMQDLPALIDGTVEGANRVADIVKALKRLSFADSGAAEEFDLGMAAAKAVQWAVKGRKSLAELTIDLPEGLVVRGHSGQLHQVVVNLMENALDVVEGTAIPSISVRARAEDGSAIVEIADNGPGIPPENMLKVFDPFFTTKPVGKGTGLGLWISYGIVRDHGGTLEPINRPGGGAIFRVTIPLA